MPQTLQPGCTAPKPAIQERSSCRICGSVEGSPIVLSELLFGTAEPFDYWHCGTCGSFQMASIPKDMSPFYPPEYYSFKPVKLGIRRAGRLMAARLGRQIGLDLLREHDFLRGLTTHLPRRGGRVVDVGSGAGEVIRMLSLLGYDCTAVDPFASAEQMPRGVRFLRCTMDQVREDFDAILLFDSLEHMPDPHQAFADIARMLRPNGMALARVPLFPNNIWDTYGVMWPGLDPPRHLYTFTLEALRHLASQHGLEIRRVTYDGRGWSLAAARSCQGSPNHSGYLNPGQTTPTLEDIEQTQRANKEGRGDAVFVELRHST